MNLKFLVFGILSFVIVFFTFKFFTKKSINKTSEEDMHNGNLSESIIAGILMRSKIVDIKGWIFIFGLIFFGFICFFLAFKDLLNK